MIFLYFFIFFKIFLQGTEAAYLKRFTDTLRKGNRLITCNITSECLEQVKYGNAVYSGVGIGRVTRVL